MLTERVLLNETTRESWETRGTSGIHNASISFSSFSCKTPFSGHNYIRHLRDGLKKNGKNAIDLFDLSHDTAVKVAEFYGDIKSYCSVLNDGDPISMDFLNKVSLWP
jgi:hypothetical protein